MQATRIDLVVTGYGVRETIYCVMHAGEVLLEGCQCPIFGACRALLAKGITGLAAISDAPVPSTP